MSENVIEQFADDLRNRSDMQTYEEVADELMAATDPRQFMPTLDEWPPLSEWPKDAMWCAVDSSGTIRFQDEEPTLACPIWDTRSHLELYGRIEIPLGIDWRTLKVSRQQMERWEAER